MEFETIDAGSPDEAWRALREQVRAGRHRDVPVEQALGCVLARDALAGHDYPPFDRAIMDGYAVRAADLTEDTTRLPLAGLVRTGRPAAQAIAAGACMRINTGAPLPAGADAVVMIEKARELDGGVVELADRPAARQFVDRRASFVRRDERLLPAGTRVNANVMAALIAGGVTRVDVYQAPRVAQLSTGDELVGQGKRLRDGQIPDSNSVALEELIRQAGGETAMFGHCPDEPAALRASLELGLSHEVLCITGGMSKGTHDLVPPTLEALGVRWLVRSIEVKPGRPTRIGRAESGCWVVGLPGNPLSCAITFLFFGQRVLDGLRGLSVTRPAHLEAVLAAPLPAGEGRPHYRPVRWSVTEDGRAAVTPLPWRGSGDPFGLSDANALVLVPRDAAARTTGDAATLIPLDLPR